MAAVPKLSGNRFPLPPQQGEHESVPWAQHLLPVTGAEKQVHHTAQFLALWLNQAGMWNPSSRCFRKREPRVEGTQLRSTE